jgi:hypothetical protein
MFGCDRHHPRKLSATNHPDFLPSSHYKIPKSI